MNDESRFLISLYSDKDKEIIVDDYPLCILYFS